MEHVQNKKYNLHNWHKKSQTRTVSFPDQENVPEQVDSGLTRFMNIDKKTTKKVTKGLNSPFKIYYN